MRLLVPPALSGSGLLALDSRLSGIVYLVGAGPGDPSLITLRGVQCLQRADVILFDYLVNPRVLVHAPAASERICLGRHGRSRIWPQAEINERLVDLALQGKTVVRLKGGDPAVFARGADELEALVQAGIPFEVVPGITAALAAGSYAGIPITHRGLASAVALVTAQEDFGKTAPSLNYESLATFPGTLVFYMGVTTAERWTGELIRAGRPAATPAAIVRRCSFPDQHVIKCTLGEVADRLAPENRIRPPVIVIIGEVTTLAPVLGWFQKRPLFGKRVMITRPREQCARLSTLLEEAGAEVIQQPAIEIKPPQDWDQVDAALGRLEQFDWAVLSSANGVSHFLERLLAGGGDLRQLGSLKLACVGPGTADRLREYHLRADLQPDRHRAEALADGLAEHASGKRFLVLRASRGRDVLAERLTEAGGLVEQIEVYTSADVAHAEHEVADALAAGAISWTTVTSSAIARSLVRLFGENLRQTQLASISPLTSATLRQLGFEPAAEAEVYTMEGLVECIL